MSEGDSHDRGHWGNQLQFILTCLGYAVGLGNVWRFPYLCGRSGGAAFMIPYLLMMVFAGFPVFYMELSLGQFAQTTPAILFSRMAPIASGLGICMIMAQIYGALYYNIIIAWAIHYLFNSFRNPLRWSHCANDFNTYRCYDDVLFEKCLDSDKVYYKGRCFTPNELYDMHATVMKEWENAVYEAVGNQTLADNYIRTMTEASDMFDEDQAPINTSTLVLDIFNLTGGISPTEEYLYLRMLHLSKGIEPDLYGAPRWELVLCLFAAWFLVFLILRGGIKTSGKVVYFTATFPYVILLILFGRGISLGQGVADGLRFYLVPNAALLKNAKVWGDAAMQIFFSLSLGAGGLTTIASYNKFHNNIFRDTLIVVLGNCLTSFIAGLVIFPVVGFIAHELKESVDVVASSGVALAFQVYPHAINRMAAPQLWAALFFFMLILLGIDSQMVLVETPITALQDSFPALRTPKRKTMTVAAFCGAAFLFGIVLTTPGGSYLLTLLDTYAGGWPIVISAALELLVVMYIYGYKHFVADIELMLGQPRNRFYKILGYPVNPYWIVNWTLITPLLLWGIILSNFIRFERTKFGSYVYPVVYDVVGWVVSFSCLAPIITLALYKIAKSKMKNEPLGSLFKPTATWGPGNKGTNDVLSTASKHVASKVYPVGFHNGGGDSDIATISTRMSEPMERMDTQEISPGNSTKAKNYPHRTTPAITSIGGKPHPGHQLPPIKRMSQRLILTDA